ncbi:hypothetical protein I302_102878 [Kwoniella bestiolae CBS 10118]|uniref:Bromo domain-containing protein n=1 Tax=Kwoniella bestiolae CBS 10118 TaxID=1296100 RepID=A0A1B9GG71_9TREE|nr:hypothetical protein I302_01573 [Kwoniella bestiolae CBS 10118]OCF30054.1 hypothetical protein I302_01573 [Kwoniella bestiolae CBS 10118]
MSTRRSSMKETPLRKSNSPVKVNASESAEMDPSQKLRIRRLGVDPTLILSDGSGRPKRKRTQSQEPEQSHQQHGAGDERDPKDPVRATELGNVIYRKIMDAKSSDGEDMAQPFIKLPNKRSFPDYYATIKHPMSLEIVHNKLEAGEYHTLKDVCTDLGQIFNNAKRYNVKESLIFQYAKKLHKMTRVYYTTITSPDKVKEESDSEGEHDTSRGITMQPTTSAEGYADADADADGEEVDAEGEEDPEGEIQMADTPSKVERDGNESSSTNTAAAPGAGGTEKVKRTRRRGQYMKDGPSVYKLIKPVLRAIRDARAKDGSGREIAGIFAQLPSRRDFPDYYRTIRNPISLEEIESKQIGRRYESFQEFVEDIDLMCQNGMDYNEDGSEVYRDAQQIREILSWHQNVQRPAYPSRPSSITPIPSRISVVPGQSQYSPSPSGYSQSPSAYTAGLPMPMTATATGYPAGSSRPPIPALQQSPRQYLPALPPGVVTEEVVASLDRYPMYERQAWAQTLPPLAMNVYRSMVATNEARKRGQVPAQQYPQQIQHQHQPVQHPQQHIPTTQRQQRPEAHSRSSHGQPAHTPTSVPVQSAPIQRVERPKPPIPTIKHIDFTFHSSSSAHPSDLAKQTIRIKNLRGVITHSVLLNSTTSEIEITAYIDDSPAPAPHSAPPPNHINGENGTTPTPTSAATSTPELSLRINGNQGSLPRFIFDNPSENEPNGVGIGKSGEKPKAMKWTLHVSTSKVESRIEIVATKPGMMAETTTIFVSRQF